MTDDPSHEITIRRLCSRIDGPEGEQLSHRDLLFAARVLADEVRNLTAIGLSGQCQLDEDWRTLPGTDVQARLAGTLDGLVAYRQRWPE